LQKNVILTFALFIVHS